MRKNAISNILQFQKMQFPSRIFSYFPYFSDFSPKIQKKMQLAKLHFFVFLKNAKKYDFKLAFFVFFRGHENANFRFAFFVFFGRKNGAPSHGVAPIEAPNFRARFRARAMCDGLKFKASANTNQILSEIQEPTHRPKKKCTKTRFSKSYIFFLRLCPKKHAKYISAHFVLAMGQICIFQLYFFVFFVFLIIW